MLAVSCIDGSSDADVSFHFTVANDVTIRQKFLLMPDPVIENIDFLGN